jgi:dihydrofolate reductase
MTRPHFTLTLATSRDGYIGRNHDEPPWTWCSSEEQSLFFADVEAADWSIMGRLTHEAADKPDRHRIVFSSSAASPDWQRERQLWIDPAATTPHALAGIVDHVRPLRNGLILGGTRVHDWFLNAGAIDRVHLTIEPVSFGGGLPMFSAQPTGAPLEVFRELGFDVESNRQLNANGTRFFVLKPR